MIADENDREAKRHYIPRESKIEFNDSEKSMTQILSLQVLLKKKEK